MGWVPVFVPAELAPEVLRMVAATLESGGAEGGPSDWADATSEDMEVFFRDAPSLEWRLVTDLAVRDRPVPVADLARALGVEVGAVAGAIGPINKRAKREGWVAPVRPARFVPEGSTSPKRGLVLAEELRSWVIRHNRELDAHGRRR